MLKYKSQGLQAWVTYTDGQYKKYLKKGVHPQPAPGDGTHTTSAGGIAGDFTSITTTLLSGGLLFPFKFITGVGNDLGAVASMIGQFNNIITSIESHLVWFFNPGHWVRIGCFILGVPLVGMGIVTMVKGSQPIPISYGGASTEISAGGIAPAFGIAEVTVGAILLFLAFHNIETQGVTDFPSLLGYVRTKATSGMKQGGGGGGAIL